MMNRIMMFLSILMVMSAGISVLPLRTSASRATVQRDLLAGQAAAKRSICEALNSRKDVPLLKAARYYTQMLRKVTSDSGSIGLKVFLRMADHPKQDLPNYEGINCIPIILSYGGADSSDETVRILKHIEKMRDLFPIGGVVINVNENAIEMRGGLYGL